MPERQKGVAPEYSRAGIAHHRFDLLAPFLLIAMNRAFGASWFLNPEPAMFQSLGRIGKQCGTIRTKSRSIGVMGMTEVPHHVLDGPPFTTGSGVGGIQSLNLGCRVGA